jgi:hypothetical protein
MIRNVVENILDFAESFAIFLLKPNPDERVPVIFIIGAPRTGTTLLYQVLVSGYRFTYFNNFTATFYAAPVIGLKISQWISLFRPATQSFDSSFGRTNGWFGPHEAASFWYRWFPRGDNIYIGPGQTNKDVLEDFRIEITSMYQTTSAPLLFKNTFNSMRIAPLVEALPEASFIVCRRDPVDTAQSILNARIKASGSKATWWSLPPREFNWIRQKPYWDQVVEQVYYTERQIDMDREWFGSDRFLDVSYRELCQNTKAEVGRIESYLKSRGIDLTLIGNIPSSFQYSSSKQVDDDDYLRIKSKVYRLWM